MRYTFFRKTDPDLRLKLTAEGDELEGGGGGDGGGDKPGADTISMPKATFNERLQRAGKTAQAKLLEDLGVASLDELKGRLKPVDDDGDEQGRKPAKKPVADPAAEAARLKRELEAERKQRAEEREELQLRNTLEREALKAGIVDIDYALTLANREVKALDEKKLAKWSPGEFFKDLAKSRPHLCVADEPADKEPAKTSTEGDGGDERVDGERGAGRNGAPVPGKKSSATSFNAMGASKAEAAARLAALRRR